MNAWTKVGIIGGAGVVGVGIGYGAYRLFNASAQPPAGTTGTTGTTTGTASSSATVWKIPQEMTGNQIAQNLGVSFSALKSDNPNAMWMIAHPNALLRAGTQINVPAGGAIPAVVSASQSAGGGASSVPAA